LTILNKIERKLAKKRIPMSVTFEVTKKCNLDCIHCYVDHSDTERELSIDEQKKVIDELYDLGVVYITFSGGELFTKKNVWELFEHTRAKKMGFKIITSGTTLKKKDMDRLKDLGILEVGISIYSDKDSVHDFITTKKGSLQKSLASAKYLAGIGVLVVSKTVIMTYNKNDIENIHNKVKAIGMIPTFDLSMIDAENNVRDPKKYALSQEEIHHLFTDEKTKNILLTAKSFEEDYCENKAKYGPEDKRCGIGASTMWVDSKGDVYPCLVYPDPVGSLKKNTLKEIWYENQEIKDILNLATYKNYKSCHGCDAENYCSPCIALSALEGKGTTCNSSSYNRSHAHKQIIDDIKMKAIVK